MCVLGVFLMPSNFLERDLQYNIYSIYIIHMLKMEIIYSFSLKKEKKILKVIVVAGLSQMLNAFLKNFLHSFGLILAHCGYITSLA